MSDVDRVAELEKRVTELEKDLQGVPLAVADLVAPLVSVLTDEERERVTQVYRTAVDMGLHFGSGFSDTRFRMMIELLGVLKDKTRVENCNWVGS